MELTMSKVLAATTVLAVALSACAASAQDAARDRAGITPLAPDSRATPMQAPVGHRQPRISDLPSATRPDDDRAVSGTRDDTDEKLRICRGC
jgi:hypothetical protein